MNVLRRVWSNPREQNKTMTEDHSQTPLQDDSATDDKRRFDSVTDALRAGKDDGAAKAREKCPQLKSGVANVVHDVAYGLAYGSTFAGAFLQELLPQSVREGFSKGASDGKEAGQAASTKVVEAVSSGSESQADLNDPKPSFS